MERVRKRKLAYQAGRGVRLPLVRLVRWKEWQRSQR